MITVDITLGSRTFNLTIKNLQNGNVRYNYRCNVIVTLDYQITNTEGWIILYGKVMFVIRTNTNYRNVIHYLYAVYAYVCSQDVIIISVLEQYNSIT